MGKKLTIGILLTALIGMMSYLIYLNPSQPRVRSPKEQARPIVVGTSHIQSSFEGVTKPNKSETLAKNRTVRKNQRREHEFLPVRIPKTHTNLQTNQQVEPFAQPINISSPDIPESLSPPSSQELAKELWDLDAQELFGVNMDEH